MNYRNIDYLLSVKNFRHLLILPLINYFMSRSQLLRSWTHLELEDMEVYTVGLWSIKYATCISIITVL